MPVATEGRHTTVVLSVVLAILFGIALTYRIRDTTDRLEEVVRGHELVRIPFDIGFPRFILTELTPEAEAAGLRPQDVVVAVQGQPVAGLEQVVAPLITGSPGDTLILDVQPAEPPGAGARRAEITLQPIRSGPPTTYHWVRFAIGTVALPYLCLALGFWTAAVRIRDRLAWLLLLLLLGLAEFVGGDWRTLLGRDDWFQRIAVIYQPVLANLWPVSMMLFGIYFPERLTLDRRFPWVKWIILTPILFRVIGTNVMVHLFLSNEITASQAIDRVVGGPLIPIVVGLHFVAISIFFAASGYRAFTERRPDARRRLMLLLTGAAVAMTPVCALVILVITGVTATAEWMLLPIYALLFVFPATMAYVIVVERAMDVRLVIRQGVQYLLARGTIRAIQVAVSAWIIVAAASSRTAAGTPTPPQVQLVLLLIAAVAVLLIGRFAERLRRWVDRRFFREAYNSEQILGELANKVRTMVETGPLLETVVHQVATSLHIPRVAILLNGGGTLEPAYALGYTTVPRVPVHEHPFTEEHAREIRAALEAEVLLPLSANQKLVGVMGLGPKQSEEPFSGADIRLLDAVAMQTGLALANSRLTAEIAVEVANREKARRELEIAREVQERLFPQELPPVPGVEYAGACRPALGVGGDYYDFIALPDGKLGIAIGDVSGKGIPAALLMATLRAYLRGQTISRESNLATMMANLNQLVYESSAPNRYATFFYGQYSPANRVFTYVNAGHNPPVVFRSSGALTRLDVGGPVIGLIPDCVYEQNCVTLESGDVLVAFTDGVSEAMNGAMEEWSEERLIAAAQSNRGLSARQLIDHLVHEADGFVSGAPQHDDMTVVVVRRVSCSDPPGA